jgi:hypothetical protein
MMLMQTKITAPSTAAIAAMRPAVSRPRPCRSPEGSGRSVAEFADSDI